MRSGVQAIATKPTFHMKTRPRVKATMTVAILWTMAPRVMPARPLTFWGFSLNLAVKEPV